MKIEDFKELNVKELEQTLGGFGGTSWFTGLALLQPKR
ncbi:bacteriocin [Listeria monocytogenes]|nr:bacteriocin [Listeria monocytogenes]EAE0903753.1 bacteriocin [Listeria monocytogenes]EIN6612439.1 bacteriocin [Listeria monocytogenes]TYU82796.1 bacteriocin [Listeria monocytogenes]